MLYEVITFSDNFHLRITFCMLEDVVDIFGVESQMAMAGIPVVERVLHQTAIIAPIAHRCMVFTDIASVVAIFP